LLVPTFHLESNHAVLFWHRNVRQGVTTTTLTAADDDTSSAAASSSKGTRQKLPGGTRIPAWGFTTINRLRPPPWLLKNLTEETGSRGRRFVDIKFDDSAPTQARLVFESSGDTLHVYSEPPRGAHLHDSMSSADSIVLRPAAAADDVGMGQDQLPGGSGSDQQSSGRTAATATAIPRVRDGRAEVLDFEIWDVVRASTAAPTYFPGG
jgi:hypothetical protein